MVPRYAKTTAASTKSGTNYSPTLKPPYNNISIDRFEDCFRSDKLIQNGIVKRTELVLGKHGKVVMDTTEEFDDPEERQKALEKIQNNTQYQEARKTIQRLHAKPSISFHSNLKAAVIQSKIYGRSALELVGSDDQQMPTDLHVLNSKRLAQPEVDPSSWKFLGVHYLDLSKGTSGVEDVLAAEDLIYITNKDFHVSPGSLYYGLSELEGIVDGSDSKRIAKQEDIKEIMKSNWAPFLILKFVNPNITTSQMQQVVDNIQPGVPFGTKQDIESQTVTLESDLKKITDAIDFLNRESLRELGVPAFVGGYEQIANYANSQQILLAYKEIELEADRTWIKDIIQEQWLNRLFYRLINVDLEAGDEPEVKLSYEFEDVSFETTLDKVNAALLLYDRQLVSGEKVLKIAGYEDSIEEYKLLQQQKEEQKLLMLQQMQNQPQQLDQFGNPIEKKGPFGRPLTPGQANQPNQNQNQKYNSLDPKATSSLRGGAPQGQRPSTTVRKRQGSIDDESRDEVTALYDKMIDTLDAISQS
jgi:hypothetical protein